MGGTEDEAPGNAVPAHRTRTLEPAAGRTGQGAGAWLKVSSSIRPPLSHSTNASRVQKKWKTSWQKRGSAKPRSMPLLPHSPNCSTQSELRRLSPHLGYRHGYPGLSASPGLLKSKP